MFIDLYACDCGDNVGPTAPSGPHAQPRMLDMQTCKRTRRAARTHCSSWKSSLHAYGIVISRTWSRVLQFWHQPGRASKPQLSQTWAVKPSEEVISRSLRSIEAP